ncbi:hypothetical protein V8C34DRAFT_11283 [Trichoderma compactum]
MRCCRRRVRGSKGGCTDSLHILCISQRRVTPVEAASLGLTTCLDSPFPPVGHILGVNSSMHCTSYRAMFACSSRHGFSILPKADNVKPKVVPLGSRRDSGAPQGSHPRRRGAIFCVLSYMCVHTHTWRFECM